MNGVDLRMGETGQPPLGTFFFNGAGRASFGFNNDPSHFFKPNTVVVCVTIMLSPALIITLLFQLHILSVTAGLVRRLDASPMTLPLARRVNLTSVHNLVRYDKSRAKALRSRLQKTAKAADVFIVPNIPIDNQAVTYTANVSFGNPAQSCESFYRQPCQVLSYVGLSDSLIVDTGRLVYAPVSIGTLLDIPSSSSNTWAGAQLLNPYRITSTTKATGDFVVRAFPSLVDRRDLV